MADSLGPTPFAVIHGDYRLDNLMFPPDGDGVVALDWQTVGVGPPARDIAYFLGTSLERAGPAGRTRRCSSAATTRRCASAGSCDYDLDDAASTTTASGSCRDR